jgi:hypothetical protein
MSKIKKGQIVYFYTSYNLGQYVFYKVLDITPTHIVGRRLVKERFDQIDHVVDGWVTRLSKVRCIDKFDTESLNKIRHEKYKIWDGKPLNENGKRFFNVALAPIK